MIMILILKEGVMRKEYGSRIYSWRLNPEKILTYKKQMRYVRNMVASYRRLYKKRVPKIFVIPLKNSKWGYTILGSESMQASEPEWITTVLDAKEMTPEFFVNNILGEVGYYLGMSEKEMECVYRLS